MPQTAFGNYLFLYNAQGQCWLDGRTDTATTLVQPTIMTAGINRFCNVTGTRWMLGDGNTLQCMGSASAAQFFLCGSDSDGTVNLARSELQGTSWDFQEVDDGFLVVCRGNGTYRYLQIANGAVKLAEPDASVDGTMLWRPYRLAEIDLVEVIDEVSSDTPFESYTFLYNDYGQYWLDGNTAASTVLVQQSIMTAPLAINCNTTGTAWLVTADRAYAGLLVQCMGSDAGDGKYYLAGDAARAAVFLSIGRPSVWQFDNRQNGYAISLDAAPLPYGFLQVYGNNVQLAPANTEIDVTMLWKLYRLKRGL